MRHAPASRCADQNLGLTRRRLRLSRRGIRRRRRRTGQLPGRAGRRSGPGRSRLDHHPRRALRPGPHFHQHLVAQARGRRLRPADASRRRLTAPWTQIPESGIFPARRTRLRRVGTRAVDSSIRKWSGRSWRKCCATEDRPRDLCRGVGRALFARSARDSSGPQPPRQLQRAERLRRARRRGPLLLSRTARRRWFSSSIAARSDPKQAKPFRTTTTISATEARSPETRATAVSLLLQTRDHRGVASRSRSRRARPRAILPALPLLPRRSRENRRLQSRPLLSRRLPTATRPESLAPPCRSREC